MDVQCIFAILGVIWVAKWALYIGLDVLAALRKFLWARLSYDHLPSKYGGKWAVVTGSTDGIGKEFARQLAKRGMNIILVARNKDKLNDVTRIIKDESPGVETEIIQVDFSDGRQIYPKIAEQLKNKDIGILVNNVGINLNPPQPMKNIKEDDIWNFVNVNMASVVAMTHLILPKMLAKDKGAIINVASIVSSFPVGLYSATKVFGDFFSESLKWECRGTGVTVQTLRPGLVSTNLTCLKRTSIVAPTPDVYVASALPTLGHSSRTTGYLPHGLEVFIFETLPAFLTRKAFLEMRLHHTKDETKKE